jgi:serine/threonine protein phosphatase PrpC
MGELRPQHFPQGTLIGRHYMVEGLVRLSEGRMFYLVNDDRQDVATRRCGSCGFEGSPRTARVCHSCGAALASQRFLMSSRWETETFRAYDRFASMKLAHPGLAAPTDIVVTDDQLLSFIPYRGEGLMLDEAAPLANQRVLHIGQRLIGAVSWLAQRGVRTGPLQRANLIVSPTGTVRLFDVDVVEVRNEPIPASALAETLRELAGLLRCYCHVQSAALSEFLELVAHGDFPTTREFGRAIEARFDAWSAMAFPPTLGGMSDVGLTRKLNEDSWAWSQLSPKAELFVVADGMGGHACGEVASQMAVSTVIRVMREGFESAPDGLTSYETLLDSAVQAGNELIRAEGQRRAAVMGTTVVAALVQDNKRAYIANVGDSRAYLFRDGVLHQITVDHSFVQKLVERGRITMEEARNHPQANMLLRSLGTDSNPEIDLFRVEVEPGDRLLMCTDGLWGEVEDVDMASILTHYADPRTASRELVRASHQGGGKDNCTLIIVVIR